MRRSEWYAWWVVCGWCVALACSARGAVSEMARRFDVAGGEAAAVLREFARSAELQLLFPEQMLRGIKLPALRGEFSVAEALDWLLIDTGLEAVRDSHTGAYAVRRSARKPTARETAAVPQRGGTAKPAAQLPLAMEPMRIEQKREFGVTTQSILRADRTAALYHHVATREEIEQSGVTNMAEFVTTLPGYSGEGAEALQAAADLTFLGGANIYAGSFLKLRGWDARHTTVLLNGRQLPASPESRGPDLSRIPLAAVERVEVLPFAGSAIYGDGAVGGAMNIVLRKDYAGRSFSAQVGESTRGDGGEVFLTWIEGVASASGRTKVTIIGDFQRREMLRLGDRDFLQRAVSQVPAERLLSSGGSLGPDLRSLLNAQLAGYPSVFAAAEAASDLGFSDRPGVRFAVVPAGQHAGRLRPEGFEETNPGKVEARRHERLVLRRPVETFNFNVQLEHTLRPELLELRAELGYARANEEFSAPDAIEPLTLSPSDPQNPFRNDPGRGIFDRTVRLYFDLYRTRDFAKRETVCGRW